MKKFDIILNPVGRVVNDRNQAIDHEWGSVNSEIILLDHIPSNCLDGINAYSHLEIIFYFDQIPDEKVVFGKRHPRDDKQYPSLGIFAQRGASRPNKIGATICKLLKVNDRSLHVNGLDAINGTPVIDIKPVMREFLPHEKIIQPAWISGMMANYW